MDTTSTSTAQPPQAKTKKQRLEEKQAQLGGELQNAKTKKQRLEEKQAQLKGELQQASKDYDIAMTAHEKLEKRIKSRLFICCKYINYFISCFYTGYIKLTERNLNTAAHNKQKAQQKKIIEQTAFEWCSTEIENNQTNHKPKTRTRHSSTKSSGS